MSAAAERRPNVVFITVDQWRGDLAPGLTPAELGAPARKASWLDTPHLDALAREATCFGAHFAQAYPCGPARASMLTGLYAHKHRSIQNGTPLDARLPTLFQAARAAGYAPLLFGYTDTTPDPRSLAAEDPARGNYAGVAAGLEPACLLDEAARPWIAHLLRQGVTIPDPSAGRDGVFALAPFGAPAVFAAADSETAFLTDRVLDHLATQGPEPFFHHISYIAPHPPFAAAGEWLERVDPSRFPASPIPAEGQGSHPLLEVYRAQLDLADFAPNLSGAPHLASDQVIWHIRRAYAAMAMEVDHHIGRIIAALKAKALWDNTIFIFCGDHGEQLFDHGLLGKLGWYDASAHIPLLIRAPEHLVGTKGHGLQVSAFSEAIDLFPTLGALLGLQPDCNLDGRSLVPFLRGTPPEQWRDAVFWSHDFRNLATLNMENRLGLSSSACSLHVVRSKAWKYAHALGLPPLLYDLTQDPDERQNLASDPGHAADMAEGMRRLLNHRLAHENDELACYQAVDGRVYGERAQSRFEDPSDTDL